MLSPAPCKTGCLIICAVAGISAMAPAPPAVPCCPHGVIRFQHRRKISSILIRDTVAPTAIRTASGSCSLRDVKSPKPELL